MDDDNYLSLARILKALAVVSLILGVIGSFLLGNFLMILIGMISTLIAFLNMLAFGEILERVVLCDSNIRIMYEEITKITDGKINNSNENK